MKRIIMKCYDLVSLEEQETKKMKITLAEPNEGILELKNSFAFASLAEPQRSSTLFDSQENLDSSFHYYDSAFEADIEKILSSPLQIPKSPSDANCSQKRRVVRLLQGKVTKSDSQKLLKNTLALVP